MTGHNICGVHPNKLLGYVAAYLHITPTNQKRTPKELSKFLGLPLSQSTRFRREVNINDREKMKRLVTWLSCVVKHVAQMVTITESPKTTNQTSQLPSWMKLMVRVTRQLKITSAVSTMTTTVRASSTASSTARPAASTARVTSTARAAASTARVTSTARSAASIARSTSTDHVTSTARSTSTARATSTARSTSTARVTSTARPAASTTRVTSTTCTRSEPSETAHTTLDVTCVDTKGLVCTILARWAAEIKGGRRRDAAHTLAMLVRNTLNPRKNLKRLAKHLHESKIKKGSVVVDKTKTWKNAGTSRHARKRGTVLKVSGGVATCQYENNEFAYDLADGNGKWFYGVAPSNVRATKHSKLTQPGGNSRTSRFKSNYPVQMMTSDGQSSVRIVLLLSCLLCCVRGIPEVTNSHCYCCC